MSYVTAAPARPCRPWCTDHHGGPDGAQCRTRVIASHGQTVMVQAPGEETRIWLFNDEDDLSVAEAEQLAYALLAQVAATRTAVAA
ncbi:hypothetical protein [Streptosporangium sp. NPDC048865]|uniref:hypothetical protein n=1 Tax=Streptosporangium sp. NPDC048865 TaxID=3155766 RepID=UPI00343FF32C